MHFFEFEAFKSILRLARAAAGVALALSLPACGDGPAEAPRQPLRLR